MTWTVRPIGTVKSVFHYKNGTPRQSALCESARGILTIEKTVFNNPEHSLEGLEDYSHAWVIFIFHKNNNPYTKAKIKPPRLNGQRVGVFSSRSPYRPNNIGLSLVKIDKVEGASVHFSGIDILDGTPVLDIKPYIPEYDKPQKYKDSTRHLRELYSHADASKDCDNNLEASQVESLEASQVKSLEASQVESDVHVSECTSFIKDSLSLLQEKTKSDVIVTKPEHPRDSENRILVPSPTVIHNPESEKLSKLDSQKTLDTHVTSESDNYVHHSIAEGFYALSSALEKAGQKLQSARNTSSPLCKQTECQEFSPISKADLVSWTVGDEHDESDVSWLVKDIISKATLDLSLTTPSASKQEYVDCRNRETETRKAENRQSCKLSARGQSKGKSEEPVVVAPWVLKAPVSKLNVTFTTEAYTQLQCFSKTSLNLDFRLQMLTSAKEAEEAIVDILHEEPRSVYRRQHCQDSLYYFAVDVMHITCWFDGDMAQVLKVKPVTLVPKLHQKEAEQSSL